MGGLEKAAFRPEAGAMISDMLPPDPDACTSPGPVGVSLDPGETHVQKRFIRCPGCGYAEWDWQEVAVHLRRHHDLDGADAERAARQAREHASDGRDQGGRVPR